MAYGILKKLDVVSRNLRQEMDPGPDAGKFMRGLAYEGYLGGYRQAILDVELALRGGHPTTRGLWDDKGDTSSR